MGDAGDLDLAGLAQHPVGLHDETADLGGPEIDGGDQRADAIAEYRRLVPYFAGEALNTTDPLLGMIAEPSRRATLLARPEGSTVWRLDIRLQGDSETVFIDI